VDQRALLPLVTGYSEDLESKFKLEISTLDFISLPDYRICLKLMIGASFPGRSVRRHF
jgi:hypothetical protein